VLSSLRGVTDALVQSSDLLQRESAGIQAEVGDALVQLQFQDRVSQILSHVQQNIARLPSYLDEHARQSSEALQPIDAARAAGRTRKHLRDGRRTFAPHERTRSLPRSRPKKSPFSRNTHGKNHHGGGRFDLDPPGRRHRPQAGRL
jgi:hypothetical protein